MPPNILHPTSTHLDLSLLSPLRTCPPSSPSVFSSSYSSSKGHSIAQPPPLLPHPHIFLGSTPLNKLSASTIVMAPDIPSNCANPQKVNELLTCKLASGKSSWVWEHYKPIVVRVPVKTGDQTLTHQLQV
ncbi:hypothetical protein CROQUDRAFT_651734 [Cronartium quercuum f. sp. fusiforme G11]|uniref:Uncharacterized protein n=1 Tax=Cronartium quercuum f. sp. fusiforme G11 TaxID=708437 RepID=A0A9P6NRI6_9BASI|nr:hypothetical protein CROQUDRAFT_651734 [Cronartium quercuum f. sp. fusiforme G11]